MIKCLNPRKTIDEESVVQLMGVFSKLGNTAKVLVLQWIILIHNFLQSKEKLHDLYPVFFHFLGYENLR